MRDKLKYNVPAQLRLAVSNCLDITSKQKNILDIGCGTGLCGIFFRDLAGFLVGIDISEGMLEQAKLLGAYDGLCRGNILDALPGYASHIFDVIIAADVFVYIGDLSTEFQIIKSCARENAILAFTVEITDNNQDFILQTSGRFKHSVNYIQQIAAATGFELQSSREIVLREQLGEPVNGMIFVFIIN